MFINESKVTADFKEGENLHLRFQSNRQLGVLVTPAPALN